MSTLVNKSELADVDQQLANLLNGGTWPVNPVWIIDQTGWVAIGSGLHDYDDDEIVFDFNTDWFDGFDQPVTLDDVKNFGIAMLND